MATPARNAAGNLAVHTRHLEEVRDLPEANILRAAILAQFPKLNLGFNAARDTSAIRTIGLGVTIDIPIFDRNQGAIATETATRQKLFDEFAARVFTARSDIATAAEDIEATNKQLAAGAEGIAGPGGA